MFSLTPVLLSAISVHGQACLPNEACGVIIETDTELHFIPCRNARPTPYGFEIDVLAYAQAEDKGKVVAIVHTHVHGSAKASAGDKLGCEQTGLPWVIMTIPQEVVQVIEPCGFAVGLLERPFEWGVFDCFTLVRDYYAEKLAIAFPTVEPYEREFWKKGQDLYGRFEQFGFVQLHDAELQAHDVLLVRIRSPTYANHAAIYLGNNQIMHHVENGLSCIELYNDFFQRYTVCVVRHQKLC